MREMRDSGVEWIGEIPKDWNCCNQKYRFTLINGRAFKDNEFEEDGTYRILRVGNLFSNPVWYSSSLELEPDKYCEKGDLIYAWSMSYAVFGELQLINPRAKSFLSGIQTAFMASDIDMADELIRKRERSLKGAARAKLSRTKEFDHSKWVGGGMLDYRFSNARRIVNDIYAGEVNADV